MPTSSCDAIVVGGGHNGLTCAAYLAKGGKKVVVLEAAASLGGAAQTIEFAPGYRVSAVAHVLNQLHPKVLQDLQLEQHGLSYAATNLATTALAADGRHLTLEGPFGARLSGENAASDAEPWSELRRKLLAFAGALKPFLGDKPPRLGGGGRRDVATLAKLGWNVKRLGREDMREFLRMVLMNVADMLEEELADPRLMGAVAFDAVLGSQLGPRSPNSLMTLLYRLAGEAAGRAGALALPKGGMGSVAAALEAAASTAGAELRADAMVARIRQQDGRVLGVTLASGEEINAPQVISAANPRSTFFDLLGTDDLDIGFVRRVKNIRMKGNVAKIHLALDGRPDFVGLPQERLRDRLVIAPTIDYVDLAFNPAKYGEASESPALELVVPTASDPSLAPPGRHVLSAAAAYAPYALRGGWSAAAKDALLARTIEAIEAYAPGLSRQIVAKQILTPDDLERDYRMTGGHWHHGELAIDQMFMLRPTPGAAQYDTPIEGLFLCGAGSHPGGGVTGAAGMNAARAVLEARA